MNNSYITIIKEKRTALSRKRIPLNQNGCTANFRIGVPFEQNLHSVQLGNTDKLFSDGLEEDEYIYFDDSKGFCYEDGCVIGGTYDQTLKVLYSQWGFDHKFYVKRTEAKKIKLELTQEEISILSNGLICLIDNAYKAEKLTCETSIIKALDESVKIYQKLNQKICNSVSKME